MKRTTLTMAATLAGLLAAPSIASAAVTAVTTEPVVLRAGPAFDFPIVDRIPDDARVTVFGCVRAYRWCDIAWRDARGWVRGSDIAYFYQERYVPVVEYGPRLGALPIVVFSFDTYWERHYRGRPWYGQRTRWRSVWRDRDRGGDRDRADRKGDRDRDRDRADRPRDKSDGKADRRADRIERQKDRAERRMDRKEDRTERRLNQSDRSDRGRDMRPGRDKSQAEVRERPARPGPGSAIQRGERGGERGGGGPAMREGGGRDGGGGGPGRGGDGPRDRN